MSTSALSPRGAGAASPKDCTPAGSLWVSAGLSWTAAAATALLMAVLGYGIDSLRTIPDFIYDAADSTGQAGAGSAGGSTGGSSGSSGGLAMAPGTTGTDPSGGAQVPAEYFVAMAVLALVSAAALGLGVWYSARAASTTERRLRQAIVSRVFRSGPTDASGRAGELLSLATHAVEKTADYRAAFLGPMLGAMSTPLLVLGIMALTVDAPTAGWLALLIVVVPLAVGGFQRVVKPIGANYRRSQGRLTAAFLEAVDTLGTLVYNRAAHTTERRLAATGEAHRRSIMKLLAGNQLLIFVVDAAFSLAIVVAAAAISATRLYHDSVTPGQAVAIVLMTVLVIGPVDIIGQFFYIGIAGRASQRQIAEHLAGGPDGGSQTAGEAARPAAGVAGAAGVGAVPRAAGAPGAAVRAPASAGRLELRGVTAGWAPGRPVLRGASLTVNPGERVALVGPSGAGKSTVSALFQAHLFPEAGHVVVDGLDTRTADPDAIRSSLAVVEQSPYLFAGSIADNLRIADPTATEQRLWEALAVGGLTDEVRAMPAGLHSPVGSRGGLLSGGQAQRLAIARASLRAAPIVILDEPTSQVGLAAESHVLAALDRLAAGSTVLMIAHRPSAIVRADRVIDIREMVR